MLAHYAGGLGNIRRIIQYKYKVGDRSLDDDKKERSLSLLSVTPDSSAKKIGTKKFSYGCRSKILRCWESLDPLFVTKQIVLDFYHSFPKIFLYLLIRRRQMLLG